VPIILSLYIVFAIIYKITKIKKNLQLFIWSSYGLLEEIKKNLLTVQSSLFRSLCLEILSFYHHNFFSKLRTNLWEIFWIQFGSKWILSLFPLRPLVYLVNLDFNYVLTSPISKTWSNFLDMAAKRRCQKKSLFCILARNSLWHSKTPIYFSTLHTAPTN
jgi:hypothetical protein